MGWIHAQSEFHLTTYLLDYTYTVVNMCMRYIVR